MDKVTNQRFIFPPLPALIAFEAAARHLSFKVAAEELQVTPSSISQHIKTLEQDVSCTLFTREHRGVSLTAEGLRLQAAIENGFTQVSKSLDSIRRKGVVGPVTICNTTAMSSLWLTPRLTQFWKSHGHIAVNQHVTDSAPNHYDEFDLLISYGKPTSERHGVELLFEDRLIPVCSPQFKTTLAESSLASLARSSLIYLESTSSWTSWQTWFSTLGYTGELRDGPHVNNYSIAVQSAQEHVGLLLGWEKLLAPLIKSGVLVTLDEHSLIAPESFYLSSTDSGPETNTVQVLKNWLLASV